MEILKIQRSLNNDNLLIYNEDRTIFETVEEKDESFIDFLFEDELKVYIKGKILDNGKFYIEEIYRNNEYEF